MAKPNENRIDTTINAAGAALGAAGFPGGL